MLYTRVIVYLKNNALLIGWKQVHSQVIWVQSCNTRANYKKCMHAFKIFSVSTFCNIFSCTWLTSNKMISLAVWCNKHFSTTTNCTCPMGFYKKIHKSLFTQNCTQNHVVTYSNFFSNFLGWGGTPAEDEGW